MIWYDNYNIGVAEVDKQHQQLAKTIKKLQNSLSQGRFTSETGETMRFLVDYTKRHFQEEEALMEKIGYEEIVQHRKLHEKLVGQVVQILLDLKKGKNIDAYELVDFLTDWLINHIVHEDKKIGKAYARQKAEQS